jgi:hypothetical protein
MALCFRRNWLTISALADHDDNVDDFGALLGPRQETGQQQDLR